MQHTCFKTQGMFHHWLTLCFCVSLFLFAARVNAQTAGTASIQGVVTDSSGAVIQDATVTATNIATLVKHTTVTDQSGLYSFPNIAIGTYTVEATAKGFERYRQSNIVLDVGSSIAINPALKIGGANQTVEVQSTGLALQTEDSSIKQTIDSATVTEMPLNGRLMTSLITLTGGAVGANANSDEASSKSFFSSAVISIGGGQGNSTDYRLDGADQNDYMTNVNLPFPFPDAVAEFSVESAALGAQGGMHPGGLVNVVTKSGTNQWHGDVFEFIRNNYINANNFFSSTKDTLHQNQFGGTFGGRIIRNKLFGFVGYQHEISNQLTIGSSADVPTAANQQGDFSSSDPWSASKQLVDPLTGIALVNNNYTGTSGVTWHLDPKAAALASLFPTAATCTAANYCSSYNSATGSLLYGIPVDFTENEFVTRVDATINAKHSLYGRYFLDGYNLPAYYSPTNILVTANAGNNERAQGFTLGETYIISDKIVNSFHATVTRRRDDRGSAATGINYGDLGNGALTTNPPDASVFNDLTSIGSYFTASGGNAKWGVYCNKCAAGFFNVNTLSLADDVNWVRGKHQIAFGGEWVQTELNVSNAYLANGQFSFNGTYSKAGPTAKGAVGTTLDGNLDFLTGAMSGLSQSKAQQNALRQPIPSLYIQDTYHATNRLVLNAGVRWDPEYVAKDFFNRGSVFNYGDFLAGSPISTVYTGAPAGSLFYGDNGVSKAFTKDSPWQFSPRIGATFDPKGDGKTVFRVGAALVYDSPNLFTSQRNQQNPPFSQTVQNSPATGTGGAPLCFDNPWGTSTTPANCGNPAATNPFLTFQQVPPHSFVFPKNAQYIVLPDKFHAPYTIQYTASVQHQFSHGWQAEIDYNGNRTDFGPYGLPMNPTVYNTTLCPTATSCASGDASRFKLTMANPTWGPYYAGGGTLTGNGSIYIMAGANASYNGMVASIQHRMSSNFVFMANYTYSHCISISDNAADVSTITIQNPANIKGDKGSCGFDFRHVFNISTVASTHFARTGLLGQAINHWEISPLLHATDGAPFTVWTGTDNSLIDLLNDRPNLTGANVYTHNKITRANPQYINAYAFATAPIGQFGNSGHNAFRGPKYLQIDAAVNRSFTLYKAFAANLRLEAFNVLNHPSFAIPNSSSPGYLGSNAVGSVSSIQDPVTSGSKFGQILSTANGSSPRIFQGAFKITF
jgi:hypothetical protein